MSYTPGPNPYTPSGPYARPPEPRRNLPLIGGAVVACTALVLGAVLLAAFMSNRDDSTEAASETTDDAETTLDVVESESPEPIEADGDPDETAVAVVEILYGQSDASPEGLLCAEPGYNLTDLETTGAAVAETLGDLSDLIDDIVASDSYTEGESTMVVVAMVVLDVETELGTVEMVVEDGTWLACDFTFY